jgi:PTH1 family peptidyl-tRNA hydrolase
LAEGIQLIVGLGNPGAKYARTRHNVGFWFVDEVARRASQAFKENARFHGAATQADVENTRCWLLKPGTFVNRSGQAARAFLHYLKLPVNQMLVVHDDLDLPPGAVKLKRGGGHGGHNGLRDLLDVLGTPDFYRVRIGIGHPGHRDQVTDYVLHAPTKEEQQQIEDAMAEALNCLPDMLAGKFEAAMQKLHTTK